jgi:hypothetical protein
MEPHSVILPVPTGKVIDTALGHATLAEYLAKRQIVDHEAAFNGARYPYSVGTVDGTVV